MSQSPEAKKHVQGSVSTEKGTQAPASKQGHWDSIKMSQSPEAKKHVKMNENWYGFSFIGANGKESRKLMANDDEDFKKRAKDWLQKNGLDPNGIQSYKELDQDEANKTKEVSNESYNNEEIMEEEDLMKEIQKDMENMRMNEFGDGSNYAPGTENDPNSPWNQDDEEGDGEEEDDKESGDEEEDNWNKPEADDSSDEKEPTAADIKKTGAPIGAETGDDEDDITVPTSVKSNVKLLQSSSTGEYWIDNNGVKSKVPDMYLNIASNKTKKGAEKAAIIIKKMEADAEMAPELDEYAETHENPETGETIHTTSGMKK
jgi:hypothetical protein